MKVAFLIPSLRPGGAEKQFMILSEALTKSGYNSQFVTYDNINHHYMTNGTAITYIPKKHKIDLKFLIHLVKWTKHNQIDILFSCFEGRLEAPMLWARLVRLFYPKVKVISGYRGSAIPTSLIVFEKLTNSLSHKIITNNNETAKMLETLVKIPPQKIRFIPNAIDPKKAISKKSEKIKEFRNLNFPGRRDTIIFGLIGSYSPVKNHQIVIKAVKCLKAAGKLDNVFFSFHGDLDCYRSQYKNIEAMIRKHGLQNYIGLNGVIKESSALVSSVDVILCPSKSEGFPNVVMEAFIFRKPVVISSGANKAGLVINGVNGLIFDANNYRELADCIYEMKMNQIIIGEDFREQFLNKYHIDSIVASYRHEFDLLAKSH